MSIDTTPRLVFLAVVLTLLGSTLSFLLLDSPPLTGVDDANITMVYGRNIAAGWGYVYSQGGERVEGSTSFLWTLVCAAVYWTGAPAELVLILIGFSCATISVLLTLSAAALLARTLGLNGQWMVATTAASVVCLPHFFAWLVWTMMDVALWSSLFLAVVYLLARRCAGVASTPRPSGRLMTLVVLGLATATRPEGLVLIPVVLLLAAVADPGQLSERVKFYGSGLLVVASCSLVLVGFRVMYFGVPVPNTFYAKVSTHWLDNLEGGARYLGKFLTTEPFGSLLFVAAVLWLVASIRERFRAHGLSPHGRATIVVTGAVSAVWLVQLLTGGDHFGSFRFYQPTYPLSLLPLLFGVAALCRQGFINEVSKGERLTMLILVLFAVFSVKSTDFSRNGMLSKEFQIAADGRRLGRALTRLSERVSGPRVGVITAGGVALTYRGRVVDLLGLNWSRMAHASGRREARLRNHSAFDSNVFWSEQPEIVLPSLRTDSPERLHVSAWDLLVLKGLQRSSRFQEEYLPVVIPIEDEFLVMFADRRWLETTRLVLRVDERAWEKVDFD